jgi:hypothetical protein
MNSPDRCYGIVIFITVSSLSAASGKFVTFCDYFGEGILFLVRGGGSGGIVGVVE